MWLKEELAHIERCIKYKVRWEYDKALRDYKKRLLLLLKKEKEWKT